MANRRSTDDFGDDRTRRLLTGQADSVSSGLALSPRRAGKVTVKGLGLAARDVSYVLVAVFALVWGLLYVRWGFSSGVIGFDFDGTLWQPAIEIREGRSPYPPPVFADVDVGNPALYPPLLMLAVTPLTFLPWSLGLALWTTILAAAVIASLYALDVRDIRCYAIALVSMPVVIGLVFANVTLLLVPLVALAWRWRDHWVRSGVIVGLAIASKIFLWPLFIWLLATRRYRSFAAAVIVGSAGVILPWALIGFDGFSSYLDLLRVAEEIYAAHSFSVATVLSALGGDPEFGSRVALGLGFAVAAAAFYAGRQRADGTSVSLAVLASILGSPIVWPYYHALLFIPIAIARVRFSVLWIVPTLFFVAERLPRARLYPDDLVPGGAACCRPDEVPIAIWLFNHATPGVWPAAGFAAVAVAVVAACSVSMLRTRPLS